MFVYNLGLVVIDSPFRKDVLSSHMFMSLLNRELRVKPFHFIFTFAVTVVSGQDLFSSLVSVILLFTQPKENGGQNKTPRSLVQVRQSYGYFFYRSRRCCPDSMVASRDEQICLRTSVKVSYLSWTRNQKSIDGLKMVGNDNHSFSTPVD